MYYKNSLSQIESDIEATAKWYENAARAWEAVEVARKKDGKEFADIGRALRGCKRINEYGFDRAIVYFSAARMYEHDTVDLYGYCDELPNGDPRKVPNGILRTRYTLTAEELRARISAKIEQCQKYAEEYREMQKVAAKATKEFREAVEEAEKRLDAYGFTHLSFAVKACR